MKSLIGIALGLSLAAPIQAQSPLVGTWLLEKSENPVAGGGVVSYCTGAHGLIIYTAEGYVSVAINCAAVGQGEEPADISGRKFFYAGTYDYDGKVVTHHLQNASQPEMIGDEVPRVVELNGDRLVLSGENQGQKFSAYWQRVK